MLRERVRGSPDPSFSPAASVEPSVDLGELEAQKAPDPPRRKIAVLDPAVDGVFAHAEAGRPDPSYPGPRQPPLWQARPAKVDHCGPEYTGSNPWGQEVAPGRRP